MRGYGQNHDIPSRWSSANSISAAQFDAIKKAAAEDGVEFEITSFNPEQIGSPPLYIWLKDHILVRGDVVVPMKANDELARLGAVVADQPGRSRFHKETPEPRPTRNDLVTLLRLTTNSSI